MASSSRQSAATAQPGNKKGEAKAAAAMALMAEKLRVSLMDLLVGELLCTHRSKAVMVAYSHKTSIIVMSL